MLECDVERVEGIEPLMDKRLSKPCRCVGSIAPGPPRILAAGSSDINAHM